MTKFLLAVGVIFALFLLFLSPLRYLDIDAPRKDKHPTLAPEDLWLNQQIDAGKLRPALNGEIVAWLKAEPARNSFQENRLEAAEYLSPFETHSGYYVILKPIDYGSAPLTLRGKTFLAEQSNLVPGVTPRGIDVWSINPHQCFGSSCR